jgi:multidrug efflux pump subunit AcrA (membrane-fusion protein)
MMSSPKWYYSIVVSWLSILGFILTGCSSQKAAAPPPSVAIETQTLKQGVVSDYSDYMGTLISRSSVTLQSQVPGQITAIYVKAGDRVRSGQPLVLIDPAQQQATVASAAAAAQSQQAGILQAQENLRVLQEQRQALHSAVDLSQGQYKRYQKLVSQNSASQQDLEQYQNAMKQAEASLAANTAQIKAQNANILTARRQYQQAQSSTRQQQVQLRYHRVVAPFTGVVGDIPVKLGNYVQPLTNLLSVTQNNQLELNVSIPAEQAVNLKVGLPVEILAEDGTLLGKSRLSFISPRVDVQAQTILIKAILPNAEGTLKADQLVNARIVWRTQPGLQIPTQSVVHMGGRDFVYVVQPDEQNPRQSIARQLPVSLGHIDGAFYVVQSGLKPGDTLIVSGLQKLSDGAPVSSTPKKI